MRDSRLPRDVVEPLDVVLMRNSRLPRDVVESLESACEARAVCPLLVQIAVILLLKNSFSKYNNDLFF